MRSQTTIPIQTAPIEVAVGAELGSYKLVSLLGEGAMGRVFKARHVKLGRAVALKVLNPEYAARADVVKRFFREARVVNDIAHEHIVEVTDFVELPGCAFLVMELLQGESLRSVLKRRKGKWPPIRRSAAVMVQVCEALDAAHQKGVVHRDLKPDNIFVITRGGGDYAKVLDFGVAKLKEPDEKATVTGMILGTPLYMAPEQAAGKAVDRYADVWAAGVVLYELLSGAVPFKGASFTDLALKIRDQAPRPLPDKTPRGERIPPGLAALVMRCLEKRPSDRFRSMASLAEALRPFAGKGRSGARRGLLWPAVVAAGIAGAGALAWTRTDLPARARELYARASRLVAPPPPAPPLARPEPAPRPQAPAVPSRSQAPATSPAPPRPAHLHRVARVELALASKPSGATVIRLDSGEKLGRTPLRLAVPRKAADVKLRFALEGYEPATASLDLRTGGNAKVTLRPAKRPKRPAKKARPEHAR